MAFRSIPSPVSTVSLCQSHASAMLLAFASCMTVLRSGSDKLFHQHIPATSSLGGVRSVMGFSLGCFGRVVVDRRHHDEDFLIRYCNCSPSGRRLTQFGHGGSTSAMS